MMTCRRCGDRIPRLTIDQIHCIRCAGEVANIISLDARRKVVRFPFAKDLRPFGGNAA
jgi:hypothetical protein